MKKTFTVRIGVEVEVDETKFDAAFLAEFAGHFYRDIDTVEKHMDYIAGMVAQDNFPEISPYEWDNPFLEGYGPAKDMGILAKIQDVEVEESE